MLHNLLVLSLLAFSMPALAASPDGGQVGKTNAKAASSEGFPGRKKYPDIPYMTIEQLDAEFDEVITVDARTPLEFETIHINSAVNIPLNLKDDDFIKRAKELRTANPGKKIVFYCNGRSCMKSYKAATRRIVTEHNGPYR